MAITKMDSKELDQLFSDYGEKYGGVKEDYFAILYLTKKYKCSVESIAKQVTFGGDDFGIDAYFIDREAHNLYLYQFKWSEEHNLFKSSIERLTNDGMEMIFGDPLHDTRRSEYLRYLKADMREYRALIDRVYIQFVFKGSTDAAENSSGLTDRIENLQNKRHLLEHVFGNRPVELIPEFISDYRSPSAPSIQDTFTIDFSDHVSIRSDTKGNIMYVGFMPLHQLFTIYNTIGQRFFDRNIRSGLSADNPPNKKIREALSDIIIKQTVDPDVFAFNHNGITLAAEYFESQDDSAIIKVPRLLNGAQTVTSVGKFFKDNEGVLSQPGAQERFRKVRVLTKLIVGDPQSDFITTVTICNNRQNPVDPWNLRANDRIQCDLHDKFREDVGIFYSRQENAFSSYSDDELSDMGIEDSRDIRIKPLAQTFCAIQGEMDRMSRLADLFENQKSYQDTFRESYLKSDARKIVLCYKIQLVLNSPMQKIQEKAPQKYRYIMVKARNLVWALLIQGLLNDRGLSDYLERFGGSLAKEADFRELLKSVAGGKIENILKEVLADDAYLKKAESGKFTFLRTKEIYRRCMDVAYEKYHWTRKPI